MTAIKFPVTSADCTVDAAVLGTEHARRFHVVSRPDELALSEKKTGRSMNLTTEGVPNYFGNLHIPSPPLDARTLHYWADAMRACAKDGFGPVKQTALREIGARLDEIASRRPVQVSGCGPRGC